MPEKTLKKLNASVLPQWKVCFLAALAVGLLAHLYKIVNWLPNWDSLVFRYDPQNMLALGRWFLPVACAFSSFYDLPFFNGMLAIVFYALGAVCVCRLFNVQKKITAALIGAVAVSFPVVTSVLMYNYVADGYGVAFFLSALAAVLLTKDKLRYYALGAVLIALSAGIYQAYITVTITLLLCKLITDILHQNVSFGAIGKKGLWMLLSGAAGVALYFAVLKILLGVFSTELIEYQGISGTASLSGIDLAGFLYTMKETFISCFFDFSNGVNVYVVLNALLLLLTLTYYIIDIVKTKLYQKPLHLLAVVVLSALLLPGACALALLNPAVDYHNLMRMGYLVFYLFFLLLYEKRERGRETDTCLKRWIVLIVSLVLVANQVVIANVSYHKAQIAYEKSYGVLIRIADRIEQTPETEQCKKLLVVGALDDSEAYSVELTPDLTGITDGYILRADDEIVGQSVLCAALNDYCGKEYTFISGTEKAALLEKEEIKAMKQWPSQNCVVVIEDIVVIKLGVEGEKN